VYIAFYLHPDNLASCRAMVFRKQLTASPAEVELVEGQIIALMNGEAPAGWVIEDTAEVYVVDPETKKGEWMPLSQAPDRYKQAT
jgi:hypothetical protein